MFFLFFLGEFLNPVVIIPGAFRSRLMISTHHKQPEPRCPSKYEENDFWINPKYFLPHWFACFFDWMTLDYDINSKMPTSKENISILPLDFGGLQGIRGTGTIFGKYFPPYFNKMIGLLEKEGYKEKENLFGAPYDWRLALAQPESFWTDLQRLIENAYENNGNKSVKILTHSLGGYICHRFITAKTTSEWRRKYIHSATLVAPSWSSSGAPLIALWRQRFPYLSFIRSDYIKNFVGSLGTFHSHLPNNYVYKNITVFVTPEGENKTGENIFEYLLKQGKINEKQKLIAQANVEIIKSFPQAPDIPINIIYNSGAKTPLGLDTSTYKKKGKVIYERGDGVVTSRGVDLACSEWKKKGTLIKCYDFNSMLISLRHPFLIFTKKSTDLIFDMMNISNSSTSNEMNNKDL